MKIRRIKNTAEKFRNRIAKMQTDNRGLTLIELIITVAIIAIFSGVVLTFITTGSNTYRSTSSSAKVQMETQELIDSFGDWKGGYNESGGFDGVSEYDRDGNYVGPMPDNAGSSGTDSTDSSDEAESDNSDEDRDYSEDDSYSDESDGEYDGWDSGYSDESDYE